MLVREKQLGLKDEVFNDLNFPCVINKLGILVYTFNTVPSFNDNYNFIIYEYNKKGIPVIKYKTKGKWKKNQTFAFDLRKDYYLEEGRKYATKIIINVENNREVNDIVFINLS